jgi:hypothetical protein
MIVHSTGEPAAGVQLMLVRTGGAKLARDTVLAVSDADGYFRFDADAVERGTLVADVVVRPRAPRAEYRVVGREFATREVRGDGGDLGRWVVDPYIAFVGEISERLTRNPLYASRVTFRRREGVHVTPDTFSVLTDVAGRFYLSPEATSFGEVVADLLIESPFILRPVTIRGVRFVTSYVDRPPSLDRVWALGPGLTYVGELWDRGTLRPVTDAGGRVPAHGRRDARPGAVRHAHDVVGRVRAHAEPGVRRRGGDRRPDRPPAQRARAHDHPRTPAADLRHGEERSLGNFGVGPSLNYAGELPPRGTDERVVGATGGVRAHRRHPGGAGAVHGAERRRRPIPAHHGGSGRLG